MLMRDSGVCGGYTKKSVFFILWFLLSGHWGGAAEPRFPQPEFESGYRIQDLVFPQAAGPLLEYVDVVFLGAALALAAYFALFRRSRRGLAVLSFCSLAYLGFFRLGCICPVGAVQNVSQSLFSRHVGISWIALCLFLLPLVFALFFGRVFCGGVCPLGAIQEFVIFRPVRVPVWLAAPLELIPVLFLGLSILLAATGTGFAICRLDPFVGFFRLSGSPVRLFGGAAVLVLGLFVARPYCRFLCPYGVLLRWMSRLSWRHLSITPGECIQCRLCENSCPVDAIEMPEKLRFSESRATGARRLVVLFISLPLMMAIGGWLGSELAVALSMVNKTARVSFQLIEEDNAGASGVTLDSTSYRSSGIPLSEAHEYAVDLRRRLRKGGWLFGIFAGFVAVSRAVAFSVRRSSESYEPDRGSCLSCGRCFASCPVTEDSAGAAAGSPGSHSTRT